MLELYKVLAQYEVPNKFYISKLETLLQGHSGKTMSPQELFGNVSDDFWLWLNTEGYRQSPALQEILPGMPDENVQLGSNGIAGDIALVDGFMIYRWVREIFESYAGDLAACGNILDFGCGWGRVIRFFLRDLEPSKLWGIDAYDKVIEICKRTNKWCNFNLVDPFPPTSFSANTFDLIFCYSVFSHLSEDAHQKWLVEFNRILKPGGILMATTWGRELIVRCGESRKNKNLPFFQRHLPSLFPNTEQWLADYESGKFCFDTSVDIYGAASSFLGEACIPRDYVLEHWTKYFTFLDFIQDRSMCPQNVIVARKAFGNGSPSVPSELNYQDFLRQQRELARLEAESVRLQRELAKQQAESVKLRQEAMKWSEERDRMQANLAGVQGELAWTQDQLQRMRATRIWRLGSTYWQAHARIKALFQRVGAESPLRDEPRQMPRDGSNAIKAKQKTASIDPTLLNLEGNRDIDAKFLGFRRLLDEVKLQHPLGSPSQYYPYGTIYNIEKMLPILDKHGIDLKQCVEGKTILDLGSGDGEVSFFLELFDPERIIAIDAAPLNFNHLEGFRALKSALQSKVELIDADVHHIDFAQLPHFDVIFCLGFLYHSPHPMWVLEKLARSTRMLFLNTKVFDAEESYAYFYDVAECNNDASNWWCYSPKTMGLMLKRAGFTIEFMERLDNNLGNSHPVDMSRDGRILAYAVKRDKKT